MPLAIALYNNTVDDEDELEFRKGDILTVLIENPHGLEGWWLCQHRGKCGLCPGNRLQLLSSSTDQDDCCQFPSRLSTASIYDSLSSSHDYDNQTRRSDFLMAPSRSPVLDNSIDSSSRSSGISSTIDLHLSSSSTEFHPSSMKIDNVTNDLQQLRMNFQKLSIHSNLLTAYEQLISKPSHYSKLEAFMSECRIFLRDYGYLLDRYTYKMIKEHLLMDLEQSINHPHHIVQISARILQYIQPMIEVRLKQKTSSKKTFISKDKLPTSLSTTQIYGCHNYQSSRPTIPTSKTYHSNLFDPSLSSDRSPDALNSLLRCYYRHIREQADLILQRYTSFSTHEQNLSTMLIQGKTLLVASQKLVFVLETLHEHLHQTTSTSLSLLTRQLNETLTCFLQSLKQLTQTNAFANKHHNIIQFKHQTKLIINLVKRIQLQCTEGLV